MNTWRLALSGLLGVGLAVGLSACPKGEAEQASPSPAAPAAASPQAEASASLSGQLPALPEGLPGYEAVQRLEASGYVVGAGITNFGQGQEQGCYLEAWGANARPRAILLRMKTDAKGNFALASVTQDPPESAWLPLLPENTKDGAKKAVENAAKHLMTNPIELQQTGPEGQRWQGEGGWQLVLAPGEEAELVGPKGGGKLPLHGRWGEADRIQQVYVSPTGDQIALVERLHHSGLFIQHALSLNPDTKTFMPMTFEGP